MSNKITLNWIVNELKQLKAADVIGANAQILYNKLLGFIKEKVVDEISFSEFFAIAVGLRFILELQQDQCYKMPGGSDLRLRPVFPIDVDNTIKRLKEYWRVQFPLLKKQVKNQESAHASKWLDLIFNNWESLMVERFHSIICYVTDDHLPKTIDESKSGGRIGLITNDLEKATRYDEYGLCDTEEEAAKEILPMTYGIDELERRWNTNRKNIIAISQDKQNKVWPYVALSKKLHLKSLSLRLHASEIKEKVAKGEVDLNYKYPYQEFARITKQPPSPGGVTLKNLLSDVEIEVKNGLPAFLWVEPPLCERVLGVFSQYVDSSVSFSPELYFMQDEIHAFEKTEQFQKIISNANDLRHSATIENLVLKKTDANQEKNQEIRILKSGDSYKIIYKEKESIFRKSKGLECIEYLITRPNKEVSPDELDLAINKPLIPNFENQQPEIQNESEKELFDERLSISTGHTRVTIVDQKTISQVRARLNDITKELEYARELEGSGEISVNYIQDREDEQEKLLQYIGSVTKKYGSLRTTLDDLAKLKKRVKSAINDALERTKKSDAELYKYLQTTIKKLFNGNYMYQQT